MHSGRLGSGIASVWKASDKRVHEVGCVYEHARVSVVRCRISDDSDKVVKVDMRARPDVCFSEQLCHLFLVQLFAPLGENVF